MTPLIAFVTDGNERPALAITRALGARGISVVVGSEQPHSLAGASRYCRETVAYPSPYRDAKAFGDFLAEFVHTRKIDAVLPVTDVTTRVVASRPDDFSPSGVAVPPLEAFESVSDKRRLHELASACGIHLPQTVVVHGASDLSDAIGRVRYPAVIKPAMSRIPQGAGWIPTSVRYARDERELIRIYSGTAYLRHGVSLIQERIAGAGTGVFALFDRGRLLTTFAHRRLREKPPTGGVSVLCESVGVDPVLGAEAERLLSPLGWHGVAMLEYKEDSRSERPALIEVNGRFWGSLQLAIDAGVDFPFLVWQLALGESPALPPSYRVGLQSRWFLGDVDHLIWRLRNGRDELPVSAPSLGGALAAFITSAGPGARSEILRARDPRPAVREANGYLTNGFGSLWARIAGSSPVRSRPAEAAPAVRGGAHVDVRE